MAFEIDFNTSPADQRVDSLNSRLKEMVAIADRASQSLIPSNKAIQELRKVAEAHKEISGALGKVAKISEDASKQMQKDTKETETGIKRFFNQLDRSLENNANKVNAWRGTYGQATQDMVRSNQQLKKEVQALSQAEEQANKARIAQGKQVNAQLVAEEKAGITKRSRDWTEYYRKQELQVNRYTNMLKKSREVWTTSAVTKRQTMAAQMKVIAEQETRFEMEEAKKRSAAWSNYYKKQEAQINRYNAAMSRSSTIYRKNQQSFSSLEAAKKKGINTTKNSTTSLNQANQVTASFRAGMTALGVGFGIYTSGTIAAAAATYALISAIRQGVIVGAEFEKSMYRVYAVTGQMGETFQKNGNLYVSTSNKIQASQTKLANTAIEASRVTIFTAVEAAEGLVALGMAGLSAQQAIGALTPSLQLAQIGMIDVYESADIMTNVMLGFGMSIDTTEQSLTNATLVTDILAAAITNSNSTIKEMSKSLSYVAPIAHAAGGSIQETVAALETFHNVGIKGQRAGTSLRRAYVNLLEPTDKVADKLRSLSVSVRDSSGEMRTLTEIMQELEAAGATTADIVTVFGVRAAPAMIAFKENLKDIVLETNRLKTSVSGAGKEMADFMATSTSGQWQIINSKIQAKFIDAFEKAKPSVKGLNYAIMEMVDNDLDGFFDNVSLSINAATQSATWLISKFGGLVEVYGQIQKARVDMYTTFLPMFKQDEAAATTPAMSDFGALGATMGPQAPMKPTEGGGGWANWQKNAPQLFSQFTDQTRALNDERSKGVMLTEEQVKEMMRQEESNRRLLEFARLESEILYDNSMRAESTRIKNIMGMKNETIQYQEKLGLITEEESLKKQIANVDEARIALNEKFSTQTAGIQSQLEKIRSVNTGTAADSKKYAELLREQAKLNDQIIAQNQQLNAEAQKLTLKMQESVMKAQGFSTLSDEVDKFATKLAVANSKLKGNTQASEENTLANFKNAVARREVFQSSSAFLKLSTLQQDAFKKETLDIESQLPALAELIKKNKELAAIKKATKDEEKEQQKVIRDFGKGKDLGDEGKGMMDYTTALDRLRDYMDNRQEIINTYGIEEIEFNNMIAEAKMEAEEAYWDSQHEHLANWRDEVSSSFANNLEEAIMMRQREGESDEAYAERYKNRWKTASQEVAATMVGTMINTMAQIAAQRAANFVMYQLFSSKEMAMDATVTTAKVAGESAKQAANLTTAATEQTANASSLAYFTQMIGLGPTLAAAWGPAAMYINIASFGAAGLAAAGTMMIAGAATAAAGLITGIAAGAGEAIGGGVAGKRQFGGPVKKGNSYMVGEAGREIFTPETDGYILNNQASMNAVGSSGGNVYYVTYENNYSIDATGNEDMEERLERAMEEASDMGKQKVLQDLQQNGEVAKLTKQVAMT
ncbi:hypothetical protein SIPHO059v1_p0017 [Vibrio phage 264E42.1]|nr:hypothetical protein SIPHO059v1_p0017 [Vibrio phage 264E42.1]